MALVIFIYVVLCCFHVAFSEYVVAEVNQNTIIYGKHDMVLQCSQKGLSSIDYVYSIVLSKIVNSQKEDVVKIEADRFNRSNFLQTIWYSKDMMYRSTIDQSTLVPAIEAKLTLSVRAVNVSCRDEGIYLCGILLSHDRHGTSSTALYITVPDSIVQIKEETVAFDDIKDIVKFNCSAALSTPGCLRWCIKRNPFDNFTLLNTDDMINSNILNNGCQYYRYTILRYATSVDEINTILRCEVATEYQCGSGAGSEVLIPNSSTKYIKTEVSAGIYSNESLSIACVTSNIYSYDTVTKLVLSKITGSTVSKLVMLELILSDPSFNTTWQWYDSDFESRVGFFSGTVYPADQANLRITIDKKYVRCSDSGWYTCEVFASDGKQGRSRSKVDITGQRIETFSVLTCNGLLKIYPFGSSIIIKSVVRIDNIHQKPQWCRKLEKDASFRPYNETTQILYGHSGCQNELFTILEYPVTTTDNQTELCVVLNPDCIISPLDPKFVINGATSATSVYLTACCACFLQVEATGRDCYVDITQTVDTVSACSGFIIAIGILSFVNFTCFCICPCIAIVCICTLSKEETNTPDGQNVAQIDVNDGTCDRSRDPDNWNDGNDETDNGSKDTDKRLRNSGTARNAQAFLRSPHQIDVGTARNAQAFLRSPHQIDVHVGTYI